MDPFKRSAGVEVYRQVRQCCYWIQGCEAIALKPESKVQLSETSQSRVAPPPFGIFLCDIRMLSTPALLGGLRLQHQRPEMLSKLLLVLEDTEMIFRTHTFKLKVAPEIPIYHTIVELLIKRSIESVYFVVV